jgi:hypothetical protein
VVVAKEQDRQNIVKSMADYELSKIKELQAAQ